MQQGGWESELIVYKTAFIVNIAEVLRLQSLLKCV